MTWRKAAWVSVGMILGSFVLVLCSLLLTVFDLHLHNCCYCWLFVIFSASHKGEQNGYIMGAPMATGQIGRE
ncbi:hypothetical protein QBC41DRAFT_47754 [Cercophora samala]|uniref:Uncharacterized protein n=1 Tax=Cercophora samala TaxID=330535 RepID=A0AA40D3R9_9PEZI|nr:hypothetical protein QBC41DRAFT_47754 [Cercophora samala]